MNERVVELIKQSGTDVSGKWMSMYQVEKFAQLIVQECMQLNSQELSITAIERLLPMYQKHFGVEE
jgi:hypothetical protein